MRKLIDRWGLREPILELAVRGAPDPRHLRRHDPARAATSSTATSRSSRCSTCSVKRNAFGRQLDSFEADLDVPVLGDTPVHAVFIRAPIVERVGDEVDVLARLEDGSVVAVRQRNVIATAFHPELAGEIALPSPADDHGRRLRGAGRGQRAAATPHAQRARGLTMIRRRSTTRGR